MTIDHEELPWTQEVRPKRLRWQFNDSISDNLSPLRETKRRYDAWLQDHGLPFLIDEVAVMVRDKDAASGVVRNAVQMPGIKLFNYATDQVETEPFGTTYRVVYNFLETDMGFRVELMHADRSRGDNPAHTGFSPLHSAVWGSMGERGPVDAGAPIVHASFKCNDLAAYDEAVSVLVKEAQHGMTCRSTYGLFSYWLPFDSRALVYLKPRVNLRDMA